MLALLRSFRWRDARHYANIFAVRLRSAFVLALCLILVAVRGTGMHAHVHHHELAPAVGNLALTSISESAAEHLAAHVRHGDVDVDVPTLRAHEPPAPKFTLAIVALLCALWLCLPQPFLLEKRPPLRPPALRRRRYFVPLSHAPPAIA